MSFLSLPEELILLVSSFAPNHALLFTSKFFWKSTNLLRHLCINILSNRRCNLMRGNKQVRACFNNAFIGCYKLHFATEEYTSVVANRFLTRSHIVKSMFWSHGGKFILDDIYTVRYALIEKLKSNKEIVITLELERCIGKDILDMQLSTLELDLDKYMLLNMNYTVLCLNGEYIDSETAAILCSRLDDRDDIPKKLISLRDEIIKLL